MPTAAPHSCPTFTRMLLLPIIFPNCYGWARPHHHQTAVTNTTASGTQTLPGTSCTAPNPPRQGTNSGEGKTGCVMLGMSHTPLAQPALAFEQGGRQVPEQRAAAACSHPARSWSIQPASVLQFQQLGGNRDLPIQHRRKVHGLFTQNFWACLLKFQSPKRFIVEALTSLSHRNTHPGSEKRH